MKQKRKQRKARATAGARAAASDKLGGATVRGSNTINKETEQTAALPSSSLGRPCCCAAGCAFLGAAAHCCSLLLATTARGLFWRDRAGYFRWRFHSFAARRRQHFCAHPRDTQNSPRSSSIAPARPLFLPAARTILSPRAHNSFSFALRSWTSRDCATIFCTSPSALLAGGTFTD